MHVCVCGGGAALAQPVIEHYLKVGNTVSAVCRRTPPITCPGDWPDGMFKVLNSYEFGPNGSPIDVLITMTGSTDNAPLVGMPDQSWQRVINDCLSSVFYALKAGLHRMRDGGNVVVVGSIIGTVGGRGCANYAAAKAGLVGLVRAAANENAGRGICINLLSLGYVDAGMGERLGPDLKAKILPTIPLRRFARPEEVVHAIEFLATTRYMTGTVLTLAGGLR